MAVGTTTDRPKPITDQLSAFEQLGELRAALDAVRVDNADLRRRLAALEAERSKLSRDDRDALSRILPVIERFFGADLFRLCDVAKYDADALRMVLDGWSAKRLGKLLARAAGESIDGLVVERVGHESNAVLWRIGRNYF